MLAATAAMSASSSTTAADFPPSSSVQRAMRSPQSAAILRPAAVEPVNVILSTRGSATSSCDTSRSAVTTLSTPGGRPIAAAASATSRPSPGASGDDFSTTVHPARSAGPILWPMRPSGPFHGMIAPTTPTGSRTRRPKPGPDGCAGSSNGNVSARPA